MRRVKALAASAVVFCSVSFCQVPTFKPGFNLFTKEQDIQLGREAAAQVERQQQIVRDPRLEGYIDQVGKRLAASSLAQGWPFSFKVVNDKSINAFALPGGPMFVNTGAVQGVENEGQLAGIMAHEMSHVILRHGTHEVSKANLLQLLASGVGGAAGSRGGILGTLAQAGVGLGANSLLLKYSRDAERQADLLGAQILSQANYNPIELARVFEKLEKQQQSRTLQFLSDHPNPGNRVQYIQEEIRYLPRRTYTEGTGDFAQVQSSIGTMKMPSAAVPAGAKTLPAEASPGMINAMRPSAKLRVYQGNGFRLSYPDNWQVLTDSKANMVMVAGSQGIVSTSGGGAQVAFGLITSYYAPPSRGAANLARDTDALIATLRQQNPSMRIAGSSEKVRLDGQEALVVRTESSSPLQGERESDTIVTVARQQGLFYLVLIAPSDEMGGVQRVFEQIINSLQFGA